MVEETIEECYSGYTTADELMNILMNGEHVTGSCYMMSLSFIPGCMFDLLSPIWLTGTTSLMQFGSTAVMSCSMTTRIYNTMSS